MRSRAARWLLPIVLVAIAGGCASVPPPTPAVDHAAINAAIDSLGTAFNAACAAKDTNAIVGGYADDAHFLPAGAPRVDGKDAIREAWVGFLSMPGMALTTTSSDRIISEAGDLVIDLGSYEFKWEQNGKPMTDKGKYSLTYKKVGGDWKIAVDTFNSDEPPPGA